VGRAIIAYYPVAELDAGARGAKGARKTKMIVALARKLLIALRRMVTTGSPARRRTAASGLARPP